MANKDEPYVVARSQTESLKLQGQPFIVGYETAGGVDPIVAATTGVLADATDAEMVRICATICYGLWQHGLWPSVIRELGRIVRKARGVAEPVQQAVKPCACVLLNGNERDEIAAA